jgi:hypothetical protein
MAFDGVENSGREGGGSGAAKEFAWQRYPQTERLIQRWIEDGLSANKFAAALSERMARETSTRFSDWVDHLVLARSPLIEADIVGLGYTPQYPAYDVTGSPAFEHLGGMFPRIALVSAAGPLVQCVAIKVDRAADFSRAHDLGADVSGYPLGPYREIRIEGSGTAFAAVERRAYRGFEPMPGELARAGRLGPHATRDAMAAFELWHSRRRQFETDAAGFAAMFALVSQVIDRCGGDRDLACHQVFEAERIYWESRNRAARAQKARQDRLGLGWANHDHHTFRSSRAHFPDLIRLLERLGFQLRERFHAGQHAGWGAQVLEQPVCGLVVFADLDLASEEADDDFSHHALPDLPRPNTVGLWVGLHGESILEGGMHHLEAQFDFERLRSDLEREAGIATMPPFSNFPFLRQAFTEGERWPVARLRADRLLSAGWIDLEQHARFLRDGAIGSHLENLQRREGYKGFNQRAVSAIIAATDPRLDASDRSVATVSTGG